MGGREASQAGSGQTGGRGYSSHSHHTHTHTHTHTALLGVCVQVAELLGPKTEEDQSPSAGKVKVKRMHAPPTPHSPLTLCPLLVCVVGDEHTVLVCVCWRLVSSVTGVGLWTPPPPRAGCDKKRCH